jgi:hypothetical protein
MSRIRYGKTMATCVGLAVVALFLTLVLTHTGPAKPRPTPPFSESGLSYATREAIKPGNYATSINIHNPSPVLTVNLYMKAVQDGGTLSAFQPAAALGPDGALEVDCTNISTLLGITTDPSDTEPSFTKGFVVIFTNATLPTTARPVLEPLDVVGVYTAEPPSVTIPLGSSSTQTQIPGIAEKMLIIPPRTEFVPFTSSGAQGPLPSGRYYEYAAKFLCGYVSIPSLTG